MILLAALMSTAAALDPGPYTVSYRDERFFDGDAGLVWVRVHYPATRRAPGAPADRPDGPFPVAAMMHGWLGSAWMYQEAAAHLASLGVVVVNMDTQTGPFLDIPSFARQTRAALRWAEDRGADPSHWLYGMADGGDFIAMGHSMGGATLAHLTDIEPRVSTLVGFMPYASDDPDDHTAMTVFSGDALYIAGSLDTTSTPDIVHDWYDRMTETEHGLFVEVDGLGHQAISDVDFGEEPLSNEEQRDIILEIATDFLRAERLGEPDLLQGVLRAPPRPLTDRASHSLDPMTWATPTDPGQATVTVAGPRVGVASVFAGRGPGRTDTPAGPIGLRDAVEVGAVTLADGLGEATVELPPALAGLAWVQALIPYEGSTLIGPAVDVYGVGDPGPAPGRPTPGRRGPPNAEPTPAAGARRAPCG
ncbi:MAG TPA: hypothetical protein PKA64_22300 [Myxococcota bacterium]|nr:hypothetical protein [Myxococcota bacterium]